MHSSPITEWNNRLQEGAASVFGGSKNNPAPATLRPECARARSDLLHPSAGSPGGTTSAKQAVEMIIAATEHYARIGLQRPLEA